MWLGKGRVIKLGRHMIILGLRLVRFIGDPVKKAKTKEKSASGRDTLAELYNRPGFLLRRANQIYI